MSTSTPDSLMPATVNLVADRLGVDQVPSYQIQAGATGVFQAVDVAAQLLTAGGRHTVLVLAGDVSAKQFDPARDLGAAPDDAVLDAASFGDAAAAVVVTTRELPGAYLLRRVAVRRGTAGLPPGRTADWVGAARRGALDPVVAYDRALLAGTAPKLAGELLAELLDGLGWRADDLARLLPPQLPGVPAAVLADHLMVAAGRCDSRIEEIGDAANPLPLLQLATASGRTVPGDRIAAVAVDPGGWATAGFALQHV